LSKISKRTIAYIQHEYDVPIYLSDNVEITWFEENSETIYLKEIYCKLSCFSIYFSWFGEIEHIKSLHFGTYFFLDNIIESVNNEKSWMWIYWGGMMHKMMWQQYNMTWIYHDIFVPSFYKFNPAKKQKIHKVFQIQWTRSDQNYVCIEYIILDGLYYFFMYEYDLIGWIGTIYWANMISRWDGWIWLGEYDFGEFIARYLNRIYLWINASIAI
jgi:hypothetical protein